MGAGQRRAPFLQPHRQLPRQRRGRVVLRHAEERDVLQVELRHQGRRQARRDRVHRGGLQPKKAPLYHRLPGAGTGHGILLRADQAGRRGASHGRVIPQASVSEILTQVSLLPRGQRMRPQADRHVPARGAGREGIVQSMSRKGNCLDNTCTESLFGHLKDEFSRGNEWPDFESFKANLDSYVRHWNARRRQGALGGLTPEEYRKSFGAAA